MYAAKLAAALVARGLGEESRAAELERQAGELQRRFEQHFWSDELGTYVIALDGNKNQCRVRTSNAGHALLCKIASRERAATTAETLLSEAMFSGWGIRTVAAGESRYNPMSYHDGSVWPHDNALIAVGLSRYGFQSQVAEVFNGMYEASVHVDLHQLPELFCGFHKRADVDAQRRASERVIRFCNPTLPPNLDEVTIENLRVADASVNLLIRRHQEGIAVEVLRREGDVEVVKAV